MELIIIVTPLIATTDQLRDLDIVLVTRLANLETLRSQGIEHDLLKKLGLINESDLYTIHNKLYRILEECNEDTLFWEHIRTLKEKIMSVDKETRVSTCTGLCVNEVIKNDADRLELMKLNVHVILEEHFLRDSVVEERGAHIIARGYPLVIGVIQHHTTTHEGALDELRTKIEMLKKIVVEENVPV